MNENRAKAKRDDQGLLATMVDVTVVLSEKTTTLQFGLLRDLRAEVHQRTNGIIDWVDNTQQGGIRLLRSANQRVDELVNVFIDSGERIGLAFVRSLSITGNSATELAARAAASLTKSHTSGERLAAAAAS